MTRINIFRYPGGKSKVAHRVLEQFPYNPQDCDLFCEPFCGGASVSLRLAEANPHTEIWLNDIEPNMAAFWAIIAFGDIDSFCDRIMSTPATVETFVELTTPQALVTDEAFAAIYLNRTAYSGKSHTSPVGGWDQSGKWKIDAEWRQEYLVKQIKKASELLHDRLRVTDLDFRDFIPKARVEGALMYVDPPYYKRGKSMYAHWLSEQDHWDLADLLHEGDDWLLSYDDCPEVRALYEDDEIGNLSVPYSTAIGPNWRKVELLIKPVAL